MASKAVTLIPAEELTVTMTPAALSAYKFALEQGGRLDPADDGQIADFITSRNAKSGWRDLWEFKAKLEKAVTSIKEVVKHAFNVGTWEDLPLDDGVKISWSKQSFTYEWQADNCGADVAQRLVQKELCSVEQVLDLVPVNIFAKAAGITQDKMMELFPEYICAKAKERTLSIK